MKKNKYIKFYKEMQSSYLYMITHEISTNMFFKNIDKIETFFILSDATDLYKNICLKFILKYKNVLK